MVTGEQSDRLTPGTCSHASQPAMDMDPWMDEPTQERDHAKRKRKLGMPNARQAGKDMLFYDEQQM